MTVSISVVIPTHNGRDGLLVTIASALAQTRAPLEVIVVCDGCSDGTAQAVATLGDHRVHAIELPKAPGFGYENRNRGWEQARGEVVAWLGHDDLWTPDHLAEIAALFDAREDVGLVQAQAMQILDDGEVTMIGLDWSVPFWRDLLMADIGESALGSISHRRALWDLGERWQDVPESGDRYLWQRLLRAGTMTAMTATPTLLYLKATGQSISAGERLARQRRMAAELMDPAGLAALRTDAQRAAQQKSADWFFLLGEARDRVTQLETSPPSKKSGLTER